MEGYSAVIKNASRELTAREKIRLKKMEGAISLNNTDSSVVITPVLWAEVAVHNELAKPKDGKPANTDYMVLVIEDADGTLYQTSSPSFTEDFKDVWSDMHDEGEDGWQFRVAKHKSANNSGSYLTCDLI